MKEEDGGEEQDRPADPTISRWEVCLAVCRSCSWCGMVIIDMSSICPPPAAEEWFVSFGNSHLKSGVCR